MGCARKNGQTENTIVSIKGPKIELSFVIIVIFLTVTTVTVTGNGACDVNNFCNKQAYSW